MFKIQHWPGGGLMVFFSFQALSILSIISGIRCFIGKPRRPFTGIERVILAFVLIGMLFKVQHWPGAGPIIVVMLTLLSMFYIGATWLLMSKEQIRPKHPSFSGIFLGFSYSTLAIGILFGTQHWPGSGPLLAMGLGSTVVFLGIHMFNNRLDSSVWSLETAVRSLVMLGWGALLLLP